MPIRYLKEWIIIVDAEVKELLIKFEKELLEQMMGTEEYHIVEKTNFYDFKVKYGFLKHLTFTYETIESWRVDKDNERVLVIHYDGIARQIQNATGKLLKIICQHGDQIIKNFQKDFQKSIKTYIREKELDELEWKRREEKRIAKEEAQNRTCKLNLKKLLGSIEDARNDNK